MIALTLLLTSCYTFENPQPVDVKDMNSVPNVFHDKFSSPLENGEKTTIEFKRNSLEYINYKNESFPASSYFQRNGRHYVISNKKEIEILTPIVTREKVMGISLDKRSFIIPYSLIVKKIKNDNYVFNIKMEDNNYWTPIFFEVTEDSIRSYVIHDDVLEFIDSEFRSKTIKYNFKREQCEYMFDTRKQSLTPLFGIHRKYRNLRGYDH